MRFSLRTLLVIVLLVGLFFGYGEWRYRAGFNEGYVKTSDEQKEMYRAYVATYPKPATTSPADSSP